MKNLYKISFASLTLLTFSLTLKAQTFTDVFGVDISTDVGWTEGGNFIDYDKDGDLDLFAGNNPRKSAVNFLYENDGLGNFTKIDTGIIVTDIVMTENGTWGDFDNDGWIDLFVANGGFDSSRVDFLYKNNGNGYFTKYYDNDISSSVGFSQGCSWADYDKDGDLDLFVIQNLNPAGSGPGVDCFYTNNGNGTFTKILASAPAGELVSNAGTGFTPGWSDYDNDNDLDLFVANSNTSNFLYQNNNDGSFTKVTNGAIATDVFGSIGCSWGDYDNDGDMDLFVCNFNQNDNLYRNNGNGTFTKILISPVVSNGGTGEGSAWGDYDNDGDLDLIVANGGPGTDVVFLYENNGTLGFTKILPGDSEDDLLVTGCWAGVIFGDVENDGDLDVYLANFNGKNDKIFINNGTNNNWVNIECIGTNSNVSAIGTKVRIKATINGTPVWQMREISGCTGYLSQNSLRCHFGLGDATIIDSIKIEWSIGGTEIYTNVAVNDFYLATENAGFVTSVQEQAVTLPNVFSLKQNFPNPFNPSTKIDYKLSVDNSGKLVIFNVLGDRIKEFNLKNSEGSVVWNGKNAKGFNVSSGTYFYQLLTESGKSETRKMTLVK